MCIQPATNTEGISKFTFVKDILKEFTKKEIQELTTKKWNFRDQSRSILNVTPNGYTICYDRISMETFSKLDDTEKQYLSKLDTVFNKNAFELLLKKGDLLLFRNDLLLHGRSEINIHSKRLLKRIRFYLK